MRIPIKVITPLFLIILNSFAMEVDLKVKEPELSTNFKGLEKHLIKKGLPIQCSKMSKTVNTLISKIISKRNNTEEYIGALEVLFNDNSDDATEALIRLESLYLGSHLGHMRSCSIYKRGRKSLTFLENPSICLDSSMAPEEMLITDSAEEVFASKQYIAKLIRNDIKGWCDFN